MKKTVSIIVGFFLVMLLGACSQTAEPVDTEDKETVAESESTETNTEQEKQPSEEIKEEEEEKEEEEVSELTLNEVLEKSTDASETLKSFAMKMELQQELTGPETMNINSTIDMKAVTEPMALYQKMNMEIPGTSEILETEMYLTEDGIYMFQPGTGWMKFPTDLSEQLLQSTPQQNNPADEMRRLQKYVDDFTFEQDANYYILRLSASGENFQEFINETLQQSLSPDLTGEEIDITTDMGFNEVEYEIQIDKETFFPSKLNMMINMDIAADGETVNLKQNMRGEYSEFNQISEITIPQEVLDSAAEIEM